MLSTCSLQEWFHSFVWKKVGLMKVAPTAKRKWETVRLSGLSGKTIGMEGPIAHPLPKALSMLDLHLNVHTFSREHWLVNGCRGSLAGNWRVVLFWGHLLETTSVAVHESSEPTHAIDCMQNCQFSCFIARWTESQEPCFWREYHMPFFACCTWHLRMDEISNIQFQ